MFHIPILFIIFRRKDVALKSLESIREAKPNKMYIACDGPRDHVAGEKQLVEETRQAVLQAIDWECDVHTMFQTHNLGCAMGVYTAINWLFEHEEQGIILEDDCVMRHTFFPFASELLERYKDDQRIGMIDGANYITDVDTPDSYGFSRYKSTNGWATWRRAWQLMDFSMNWRSTPYADSIIANSGFNAKDMHYWKYRLKAIDANDVSAWDWQWYFTLAAHNQLTIYPKTSLTTNIGFGEGATHTTQGSTPQYYISNGELEFPLQHPRYIVPYQPFERGFYRLNNSFYNSIRQLLPFGLKRKLKKILRK
jgi:hypothetical protein